MKNSRVVIVFLMVFVALAALVAYQTSRPTVAVTAPTPGISQARVFQDISLGDIQAVRLRSPETGASLVLTRAADGSWTAPELAGTLNTEEADNIAKTMVLLPYSDTLTVKPGEDMSTYGLSAKNVLSIQIVLTDGGAHAVEVGYRNPTEDSYYALVDDRPDLYLLERAAIDFLISRVKSPPLA